MRLNLDIMLAAIVGSIPEDDGRASARHSLITLMKNLREFRWRAEHGDGEGAAAEFFELYCVPAEWEPPEGWEPPKSGEELAELRLLLHRARLLVGHEGTPTHVMRDLAGMGIRADQAGVEVERLEHLVWGAVHNAGKRGSRRQRWVAVKSALGVGSTTATELCVAHDLDPDEMVGRDDDDGSEA